MSRVKHGRGTKYFWWSQENYFWRMALQLGIACRRKIPLHKLFCAHCWTMPSGSSSAPGRKFGRFSKIFHVFRAISSWICILLRLKSSERIPTKITGKRKHLKEPVKFRNKTRFFIFFFITEQDHLRMNVAPDQTIILVLQIFLDHRSLSSIDQKSWGATPKLVAQDRLNKII